MDNRAIIMGLAVAAGALALLVGAFFLLSPSIDMAGAGKSRPAITAEAGQADEKPVRSGPRVKVPDDPALQIVDVPEGQTIDDGGLAFADALCKKTTECGCEKRAPKSCATAWGFVKKEDVASVKCLFESSCDDLCLLYQHPRPRDVSCIQAMGKLETAHILHR
jgi:hypothetical protein